MDVGMIRLFHAQTKIGTQPSLRNGMTFEKRRFQMDKDGFVNQPPTTLLIVRGNCRS